MATVALDTAGVVQVIEWPDPPDAVTLKCSVALVGGTLARENSSGDWEQALATSAAAGAGAYLLLRSGAAGEQVTGIKRGTVDGYTVSQAQNANLFMSDTGTVADAAGTASIQVGRVLAGKANLLTAAADKVVRIDIPV